MRVVLPWSTCAITATLRRRLGSSELFGDVVSEAAVDGKAEKAREMAAARNESTLVPSFVTDEKEDDGGDERDLRVEDQRDRINGPAISNRGRLLYLEWEVELELAWI